MTIFKAKFEKHQTLRERVADMLRDAIIHGKLKPDERVSEPELARRLGISRTPIREALRQLDSEGFVVVIPRRGARIVSISEKDVTDFYELKSVLEGYAARLATKVLTDKDIDKMENINNQMSKLLAKTEWKQIFRFHNEFHEIFIRACGNEQLYQTLLGLTKKFQRFRILLLMEGKAERSIEQHKELIVAFKKRDAMAAERLAGANAILGKELIIKDILHKIKGMDTSLIMEEATT